MDLSLLTATPEQKLEALIAEYKAGRITKDQFKHHGSLFLIEATPEWTGVKK